MVYFNVHGKDPPADADISVEDAFLSPTVFVGAVVLLFAACKMAGFRSPEPVRTRLYTLCTETARVIVCYGVGYTSLRII